MCAKPVLCAVDEYIDHLQRDCDWAQAAARESDAAAAIATERAEAAEGKLASLSQEAERAVEKVARLEQELAVAKTATEWVLCSRLCSEFAAFSL